MNALEIKNLHHSYGDNKVLTNVNLRIPMGQFVALVGPSGCGKSTLFKMVLGTHHPTGGDVLVEGQRVERPNRNVGIVYQHYSLYDFLTAKHNVAFGPMLDQSSLWYRIFNFWQWRKAYRSILERSCTLLTDYGLKEALDKYPKNLSGGMRQRVALAQAIIMQPKILLLDEPFGALDEITRHDLQQMLRQLSRDNATAVANGLPPPYTILMVTHELNEAFYVADRVVGLSQYHGNGFKGATITYDKKAPTTKDFDLFRAHKDELKKVVFDEDFLPVGDEFVTFWKE